MNDSFARAQAEYDRKEQADHSQDVCANCGLTLEEHERDEDRPYEFRCEDGGTFEEQDEDYDPGGPDRKEERE